MNPIPKGAVGAKKVRVTAMQGMHAVDRERNVLLKMV
jgi:hypothetical protein